jgi:hypothetical protein
MSVGQTLGKFQLNQFIFGALGQLGTYQPSAWIAAYSGRTKTPFDQPPDKFYERACLVGNK